MASPDSVSLQIQLLYSFKSSFDMMCQWRGIRVNVFLFGSHIESVLKENIIGLKSEAYDLREFRTGSCFWALNVTEPLTAKEVRSSFNISQRFPRTSFTQTGFNRTCAKLTPFGKKINAGEKNFGRAFIYISWFRLNSHSNPDPWYSKR